MVDVMARVAGLLTTNTARVRSQASLAVMTVRNIQALRFRNAGCILPKEGVGMVGFASALVVRREAARAELLAFTSSAHLLRRRIFALLAHPAAWREP